MSDQQPKEKNKDYFWNTVASLVNASEAIIILSVATRTVGLEDSGILTISFSIANLLMCLGKYGMRSFQVTDIKRKYSFSTYYYSRLFTLLLMVLSFLIYIVFGFYFKNYSIHKASIMAGIVFIYCSEVLEDVFWGEYQIRGKLYKGAKLFSFRWILSILTCSLLLIFTKNTFISAVSASIVSWSVLIIYLLANKKIFSPDISSSQKENIGMKKPYFLLKECFPLFLTSLLSFYIVNSSKYAIDGVLSEEVQACYGFVSMPIFVIGLLNTILYHPILVHMAREWNSKELSKFTKRIITHCTILMVSTALIIIVSSFLGIPILSILYSTDLSSFKFELLILLFGGMWLALSGFFSTILVIMRKMNVLLVCYSFVALFAFIFTRPVALKFGTKGIAAINAFWMFLPSFFFLLLIVESIKKASKS